MASIDNYGDVTSTITQDGTGGSGNVFNPTLMTMLIWSQLIKRPREFNP